jgi:predicted AlkP superfamily phosphohydrolase/phosphomutase
MLLTSKKTPKMVVLGLDGLPLTLARKIAPDLPNLKKIIDHAVENHAEIPELSPVNWTSLYTGVGPEKHGIYGFTEIDHLNYKLSITDFSRVKSRTIFDKLDEHGLRTRSINLPNTYPARKIRGMMISGFVAHDIDKAVYPHFLASRLKESGYLLEADTTRGIMDPYYLLKQVYATLECRMKALDMLFNDLGWDLFIFVLTETDRLFHFFYPAFENEAHDLHKDCLKFLKTWDAAIGIFLRKYENIPGNKRLLVLADHGFTSLETEIDINAWLKQNGYLSLKHTPESQWDASAISDNSSAFALDPGRIYIHTRENFSRGCVDKSNATFIAEKIRSELINLSFNGTPVFEHIYTGKELYGPDAIGDVPDLVCRTKPGYDLKAKFDRDEIFGFFGRTGTHTVGDAFFYDSQGNVPERMRDTGQMILDWFGI